MQRFSRERVHDLDAEGRERAAVVGFLCEHADRLFDEGVEALFRREVRRIAGYRRPVAGRYRCSDEIGMSISSEATGNSLWVSNSDFLL